MKKNIIWVGLNPSTKNTDPNVAFVGSPSGKNLAQWQVSIDQTVGPCTHKMYNLYDKITAKSEDIRGEDYNQHALSSILNESDAIIVALGKKTAAILAKLGVEHYAMPHPSPRNRQLNNSKNINKELQALTKLIESF